MVGRDHVCEKTVQQGGQHFPERRTLTGGWGTGAALWAHRQEAGERGRGGGWLCPGLWGVSDPSGAHQQGEAGKLGEKERRWRVVGKES